MMMGSEGREGPARGRRLALVVRAELRTPAGELVGLVVARPPAWVRAVEHLVSFPWWRRRRGPGGFPADS